MTGPSEHRLLLGCESTRALAAELALGTLNGEERANALAHLDTCSHCREVVDDLSLAADAILLAAPQEDPPVGFEVRLLERVRNARTAGTGAPHSGRRSLRTRSLRTRSLRARAGIAAAVVAAAGAGIALGEAIAPASVSTQTAFPRREAKVEVAQLETASHRSAGNVMLTATKPSWLFMSIHDLGGSAWVQCVVTTASGKQVAVGSFSLSRGYGSWSVELPPTWRSADVKDARIVSADGQVLASATF